MSLDESFRIGLFTFTTNAQSFGRQKELLKKKTEQDGKSIPLIHVYMEKVCRELWDFTVSSLKAIQKWSCLGSLDLLVNSGIIKWFTHWVHVDSLKLDPLIAQRRLGQ